MIGTYRVYSKGKLISTAENLITAGGKKLILRYLAGQVPSYANYIAAGTGAIAPTINDTSLAFEFLRGAITVKAIDYSTNRITMKAEITDSINGVIYELGVFPNLTKSGAVSPGTSLLTSFDSSIESWTGATVNTTNKRIGLDSMALTPGSGATTTALNSLLSLDLSSYSNFDQFALAFFINDVYTSLIRIRLYTDSSNYYTYSFNPGTTIGYTIKNFKKNDFTTTGAPSWSNITSVDISVTAGASATAVQFDGLSIIDKDVYEDYNLVSRAVLSTPVVKELGQELDVEYVIEFDI